MRAAARDRHLAARARRRAARAGGCVRRGRRRHLRRASRDPAACARAPRASRLRWRGSRRSPRCSPSARARLPRLHVDVSSGGRRADATFRTLSAPARVRPSERHDRDRRRRHRRPAGARASASADALHAQRRVRPGRQPAAGARARRGRVRVRHRGPALPRRAELAVLLPAGLLVRRGDGRRGGRAALDARVQHQLGDRASAGDPARRGAGRARARRPQPRVLHQWRLGVRRGGVEDRPPALPGHAGSRSARRRSRARSPTTGSRSARSRSPA